MTFQDTKYHFRLLIIVRLITVYLFVVSPDESGPDGSEETEPHIRLMCVYHGGNRRKTEGDRRV